MKIEQQAKQLLERLNREPGQFPKQQLIESALLKARSDGKLAGYAQGIKDEKEQASRRPSSL